MNDLSKTCVELEELSAYVDGDLGPTRMTELQEHLKTCAECMEATRDFEKIRQDLKELNCVRPELKLWRRIDESLETGKSVPSNRRKKWHLVLAPAAAAAIVVAFVLGRVDFKAHRQTTAPVQDLARALDTVENAERTYRDAIASLEKAYISQKPRLSPKTIEVVETSLAQIDNAIDRLRKTVARDPLDMEANRAVFAAYRQKMDLLFELVEPVSTPEFQQQEM